MVSNEVSKLMFLCKSSAQFARNFGAIKFYESRVFIEVFYLN